MSNKDYVEIDFPIVVPLIKPIIVRDTNGNEVERIESVSIPSEPCYGDFKKLRKVAESEILDKAIELFTDLKPAYIGRLSVRDVRRLEIAFAPFIGGGNTGNNAE